MSALHVCARHDTAGRPQLVELCSDPFPTRAEAEAFRGRFPKTARLRLTTNGHWRPDAEGATAAAFFIVASVPLAGPLGSGTVDPAGLRRLRAIRATAARLGVAVDCDGAGQQPDVRAYRSLAELDAAVAAGA